MPLVGQLGTRAGSTRVGPATGQTSPVHSIFYLSDPVSTYPTDLTLYVIGAGTAIYSWDGSSPSWTSLATGFSGNPLTGVVYRLNGTGQPWLIIGDSSKMIKIAYYQGAWTVFQLGITPPDDVANVTVLADPLESLISYVNQIPAATVFAGNSSSVHNSCDCSSAVRSSGVVTFTATAPENFAAGLVGELLATADVSFIGTFPVTGITSSSIFTYNQPGTNATNSGSGTMFAGWGFVCNSGATATMSVPQTIDLSVIDGNPSLTSDTINCWIYVDTIAHATDVQLLFDIDPSSVSGGSLTGTAFTKNYYYGSVYSQLSSGWTLVSLAKSAFTRVGQGTYNWMNVVAWQLKCVAAGGDTPECLINNMYMLGANYPNTSVGVGYDYRYTFYNDITQSESNPSPIMSVDAYPVNQPVELIPGEFSTDPQVNEIRWYRRGGTLASNWYLLGAQPNSGVLTITSATEDSLGTTAEIVASKPHGLSNGSSVLIAGVSNAAFDGVFQVDLVLGTSAFRVLNTAPGANVVSSGGTVEAIFLDGQSDTEIATAPVLSLLNDVPITSIDINGVIQYGVPLKYLWGPYGGTTGFGSGDPNQPGNLYWWNSTNPDGWGSTNFAEVTQPSDPLLLGVYWQGTPWARSMESLYQIFPNQSANGFYSVSDIGSGESLAAPWALVGGSGLPFMPWLGKSGLFVSTGGVGTSITDDLLWPLFDPKSTRTDAVDWTFPQFLRIAYYDHHLRFTYQGKDAVKRFYRYNVDRHYWDGPHIWAFGGCYEFNQPEVQENLLVGGADGNLYQQSTAATTDNGVAINVLVQTGVYKADGFEADSEWGHISVDAAAPVGGISVLASFNATQTGYVPVGSCVSTTRTTQPMSLLDSYSCGASFEFQWTGAGSLFGFTILHRSDGIPITHCEVPATSFGVTDFQHLYRANVALRSTGIVNCSVVVDNVAVAVQPIPSTGNTRLRQQIFFPLNKGQLYQISLDAATANQGFRVYPEDSSAELLGWNELNYREVQLPFTGGFTP